MEKGISAKHPLPRWMDHVAFAVVFILVPYLAVLGALNSASPGVHGTLCTTYVGVLYLDINGSGSNGSLGPPGGHHSGDATIDGASGWLFCNGKVQRLGPYRIKGADFDYAASGDRTLHGSDYGVIRINGEKGDLATGLPVWAFALVVLPFGITGWAVNEAVRKWGPAGSRLLAPGGGMPASLLAFLVVTGGSYCWPVTAGIFAVLMAAWLVVTLKAQKLFSGVLPGRRPDGRSLMLPTVHLVAGLLLFCAMASYAFNPPCPPYSYDLGADSMHFYFGMTSMVLACLPMAWGISAGARLGLARWRVPSGPP